MESIATHSRSTEDRKNSRFLTNKRAMSLDTLKTEFRVTTQLEELIW